MALDVKALPVLVCENAVQDQLLDIPVDCSGVNAVNVHVFLTGAGVSADVTVEGSSSAGGNSLTLPDLNASQTGLSSDTSFDVIVGSRWARVRLANVAGTFAVGQGITIFVTPYVSPGSARVAASISVANLAAINANMGAITAGSIVVGTTNKIWLNEGGDGILAIGGAVKASASFRVTAAGALTATSATISGAITITSGSGILNLADAGALAALDVVTASEISVTTLSAISANMGAITAGSIVVGTTNKIWLNEGGDGILAIGGAVKASASFRVTAAGALTATSATITGTVRVDFGSDPYTDPKFALGDVPGASTKSGSLSLTDATYPLLRLMSWKTAGTSLPNGLSYLLLYGGAAASTDDAAAIWGVRTGDMAGKLLSVSFNGQVCGATGFYPGFQTSYGLTITGTTLHATNLHVDNDLLCTGSIYPTGNLYPTNQTTYYLSYDEAILALYTNASLKVAGSIAPGNQTARYMSDNGSNIVVDGVVVATHTHGGANQGGTVAWGSVSKTSSSLLDLASTVSGSVANVLDNTATTVYTLSAARALYSVVVHVDGNIGYSAQAIIVTNSNANQSRICSQNDGTNMFITLTGTNQIQARQTSGVNQTVYYVITRIG